MASSVGFPVLRNFDNFCITMRHLPPRDFFSCSTVCQVWRAAYSEIESYIMKPYHENVKVYIKDSKYSYKSWYVLDKTMQNGCSLTFTSGPSMEKKKGSNPILFYLKYLGNPIGRPEVTVDQIEKLCEVDQEAFYDSHASSLTPEGLIDMSKVGPDFKVTLSKTFCKTKNFHTFSPVFLYEAVRRPIRKGEFLYLDEKATIELAEIGRIREGRFAIHNEKWANEIDVKDLELAVNITEIEVALSVPNLAILLNCPLTAGHKDTYFNGVGYNVCSHDGDCSSLPCTSASSVEFVRRNVPIRSFHKTWNKQLNSLPHYQNIARALPLLFLHGFERLETGKCALDMRCIVTKEGKENYNIRARTPESFPIGDDGECMRVSVGGGCHSEPIEVVAGSTDEDDESNEHYGASPCISAGPSTFELPPFQGQGLERTYTYEEAKGFLPPDLLSVMYPHSPEKDDH